MNHRALTANDRSVHGNLFAAADEYDIADFQFSDGNFTFLPIGANERELRH